MSQALKEHGNTISDSVVSAMRTGAVTPMRATPDPHMEKAHIMNLLRQGQINAAFQQVCHHTGCFIICVTISVFYIFELWDVLLNESH